MTRRQVFRLRLQGFCGVGPLIGHIALPGAVAHPGQPGLHPCIVTAGAIQANGPGDGALVLQLGPEKTPCAYGRAATVQHASDQHLCEAGQPSWRAGIEAYHQSVPGIPLAHLARTCLRAGKQRQDCRVWGERCSTRALTAVNLSMCPMSRGSGLAWSAQNKV